MSTTNSEIKNQLDELSHKIDIHKALVGFAFNAHAKLSLKGISKLIKSISNPIERVQATKWLETFGSIFSQENHQTLNGELIPTFIYKPTPEFNFDLKKAWSNPYYSETNFHLSYPFFNRAEMENYMNILSPYWFVEPDKVKEKIIQTISKNSPNDSVIRQTLENAINAFWRSHKHDAAIRSNQENAQLMFRLDTSNDGNLSKKITARTISMLTDFLSADTAKQKAKASVTIEKNKPSESRPKNTEECYVCSGSGKTSIGRICSRCTGRGFIGKVNR